MRTSLAIDDLAAHHALTTLPDAWLDHIHGHVSADEAAAAASVTEPDELVERSRVLFAPPSAEDEERRLQALLDAHFAEPIPTPSADPAPSAAPRSRRVVIGVVTMLAASMLLWLGIRPTPPPPFDGNYDLRLSSGYLEERAEPGDSSALPRYHEHQRISLNLRPAEAITGPLAVEVFAISEDGRSHVLDVETTINDVGVVVASGTADAMGLSAGRWTLVVVVGPPKSLPADYADVHDGPEAPYDVHEREVEIVSTDPAAP